MAIVRAISAQYRRFGHLQSITASTVRVLAPKTTSADDKRAKTRIFLIFVLLLHGSPRYRIKLNFGRIMRKFRCLRALKPATAAAVSGGWCPVSRALSIDAKCAKSGQLTLY